MQKLFFIIIFLGSLKVFGQENKRIDSIFYLIDTVKTPVSTRMWDIHADGSYKYYTIQCPCLNGNGMPTFFYSITDKEDVGKAIDKREFKNIKLITLPALILKSKQVLDTQMISRIFFFIEPNGKKYIVHNVSLINPAIKIVSGPDVINTEPDNSAFEIKGLIEADSKDLAKYYNKSVITKGNIVNRIVDSNMVLLIMGSDFPNQDFTIMIRGEKNINKFEPDFLLKGKNRLVKVTGKVFEYKGKPAIEISNENQIQQIRGR